MAADLDSSWLRAVGGAAVGLALVATGAWSLSSQTLERTGRVDPVIHPRTADEPEVVDELVEPVVGRYREAPLDEAGQLAVIGYTSGSREAGDVSAVTLHDSQAAFAGLNLYASGHAPVAVLMDMDGNEQWRWQTTFDEVWPHWAGPKNEHTQFWRRVHLLEDGSLLAIFEGIGLVKLDRDSNIVWARPNAAHHDLDVMDDGSIWVLSRRSEVLEEIEAKGRSVVDYALHLDPQGRELQRISLMTAYVNSRFRAHYLPEVPQGGDTFHTNTLHVIREDVRPPFLAGNLIVSMRHLNTVAVVDPGVRRVIWSLAGDAPDLPRERRFHRQHDPQILDNGNLLLFDNGPDEGRSSQVLEVALRGGGRVWAYSGSEDEPFWSRTCGTAQRLDNGNTLVTESDGGRAFEVTVDGSIVWEFHNPARPEDNPELVATLFEMRRLKPGFPVDWMEADE